MAVNDILGDLLRCIVLDPEHPTLQTCLLNSSFPTLASMTPTHLILRLEALAKQTRCLVESLRNIRIHPTKEQYDVLEAAGLELSKAATHLPLQVEALKSRRTESEEGRKLVVQADSVREDLIVTCRLKNRTTFGRNIILFFEGPKWSPLDSEAVKARKKLTHKRCELICGLSPNAVISWAAAFTPSLWTANLMSRNTFDHVIEYMEPEDAYVWLSEVC